MNIVKNIHWSLLIIIGQMRDEIYLPSCRKSDKFCYNALTYWISIVHPVIKVKYCWYFIKIFSLIWTGLIELLSWIKFCSNLIISSCGRLSWNCIYNFPISPWLHYTIFALPLLYITEITGAREEEESITIAVWR